MPGKTRPGTPAGGELLEANYLFDPERIRDAREPPEDSARLIWMFLTLVRRREVDYAAYSKEFRRGLKTFKRDLAKLRGLGARYRFALTALRRGRVALAGGGDLPKSRERAAADAADTLRAVAEALGEVVSNDLLDHVDTSASRLDPFLQVAVPRLSEQTHVAAAYRDLRRAWSKRARVRFRYPLKGRRATEERTVEPHLVTYCDGRYYLVAFDRRPKTNGWRQFALDRITGPIQLAGSFAYRVVPREYRGRDSVGLFKSGGATEVTIELSPLVAEAVAARTWQSNQRVESRSGGRIAIAFEVFDVAEAVRWALGFGAEARIVAPPAAVRIARDTASAIVAAHDGEAGSQTA